MYARGFCSGKFRCIRVYYSVFLFYLVRKNDFIHRDKTKQYLLVVCMTSLALVLEVICDYLSYAARPEFRIIMMIVDVIYFTLLYFIPPLISMLYNDKMSNNKLIYFIPAIIGTILCVASLETQWMFNVSSQCVYSRGDFFIVHGAITLFGYGILLYANYQKAKEYDISERSFLWLIYTIMLITAFLQSVDRDMQIMWGGAALSELLYYIFLRELQFKYDVVTQVRNRISFEQALSNIEDEDGFFLIEFDVNNLKYVNDHMGHAAGDRMLYRSAHLIKKAYEKCGYVYRIGGDEFIVIGRNCDEDMVNNARLKLLNLVTLEDELYQMDYYIANAYSRYDKSIHKNVHDCFLDVDKKMYEDKKKSKLRESK